MAFELFPTPSGPQAEFAIPFSLEHKRFPHKDDMVGYALVADSTDLDTKPSQIYTYWGCDCANLFVTVEVPTTFKLRKYHQGRYTNGFILAFSPHTGGTVECSTIIGMEINGKKTHFSLIHGMTQDLDKVRTRIQSTAEFDRYAITIPWSVLQPLRPLLYQSISLNFTLINHTPQGLTHHQLVTEPNFTESSQRLLPVDISPRFQEEMAQSFLTRAHWRGQQPVQINLGMFNPQNCPGKLELKIYNGSKLLEQHSSTMELGSGCHNWTLRWSPQRPLPTGSYSLELSGQGCGSTYKKKHIFTVIDPNEQQTLYADLLALENDDTNRYPRAVYTALADLQKLEQEMDLFPWHSPDLELYNQVQNMRNQLRSGINPLPDTPGLSRRAFRSHVDDSLRPYNLYLPKSFLTGQKWPLLMILTDQLKLASRPDMQKMADRLGVVLLFPHPRIDKSFYLGNDEQDILQSLTLAKKYLPIDWDKIFLCGISRAVFSTWHTGLRHREHFAGLAVIAGIPTLPFPGVNSPTSELDLMDTSSQIPILMIHGGLDSAMPEDSMRKVVTQLQAKDMDVTYKECTKGVLGNFDWIPQIGNWLKPLLKT